MLSNFLIQFPAILSKRVTAVEYSFHAAFFVGYNSRNCNLNSIGYAEKRYMQEVKNCLYTGG